MIIFYKAKLEVWRSELLLLWSQGKNHLILSIVQWYHTKPSRRYKGQNYRCHGAKDVDAGRELSPWQLGQVEIEEWNDVWRDVCSTQHAGEVEPGERQHVMEEQVMNGCNVDGGMVSVVTVCLHDWVQYKAGIKALKIIHVLHVTSPIDHIQEMTVKLHFFWWILDLFSDLKLTRHDFMVQIKIKINLDTT